MTIIVFLVDNSASMNARTYLGTTLLDVAKGAVENFIKMRARDPSSRMDRYMLISLEEPPYNIKAGWKESVAVFNCELKNMAANGVTTFGVALKRTFDLLNLNRVQHAVDSYGNGRNPSSLESAVIICVTDGRKLTTSSGFQDDFTLPMLPHQLGSELTLEPFRWDQRLYSLVLRIPAVQDANFIPPQFVEPATDASIDAMCEVTGGRSYRILTQRMLMQCLESLCQKCQTGVVVKFEFDLGRNPLPPWASCTRMLYVKNNPGKGGPVSYWPIPESYFPDFNAFELPKRTAHPVIKIAVKKSEPITLEGFPFDKYELEPSPLTQHILEKRDPSAAFICFIPTSGRYEKLQIPFGYLKASTSLHCVNLFVMPFNYPVLLPLVDELIRVLKCKPTDAWKERFQNYLAEMPPYYMLPLSHAFERAGLKMFDPGDEPPLPYKVNCRLKKLKLNAKTEFDRLVEQLGQKKPEEVTMLCASKSVNGVAFSYRNGVVRGVMGPAIGKIEVKDSPLELLSCAAPTPPHERYSNPFSSLRKGVRQQLRSMRSNFSDVIERKPRAGDVCDAHNVPISQMGNYQEVVERVREQELRPIENNMVRAHTFGNPFKLTAPAGLMVDEAEVPFALDKSRKRGSPNDSYMSVPPVKRRDMLLSPNQRKRGPLPRSFTLASIRTPPPSPQHESIGAHSNDSMCDSNEYLPFESCSSDGGFDSAARSGFLSEDAIRVRKMTVLSDLHLSMYERLRGLVRSTQPDGEGIFSLLEELNGATDCKRSIVESLLAETRFLKRSHLSSLLSSYAIRLSNNVANASSPVKLNGFVTGVDDSSS